MRLFVINFLKQHPVILRNIWFFLSLFLTFIAKFIKIKEKNILFASFGGRNFDDSPKAIYDEICNRKEFDDWNLIWAFVEPDKFDIPRGNKIKIDTLAFFKILLTSHVWVSNSGMDRGIEYKDYRIIKVETWHGCPLKKIGGEENQNSLGGATEFYTGNLDDKTIRCAQSEYDRDIFSRIFHATKESFLMCDLPRNDALLKYTEIDIKIIKEKLGIPFNKRVILYTPTYREYLIDQNNNTYIAPPLNLKKWQDIFGSEYVFLIRAHYAVNKALNLKNNEFIKNVSEYYCLNDLYAIADMMISDYSSTYFDYAILSRPMFCFAYDLEEYEEKRGLYLNLAEVLPCPIAKTEDEIIENIRFLDVEKAKKNTKKFREKFVPHAGRASTIVVDKIIERLLKEGK